jgi:hypothetical protein
MERLDIEKEYDGRYEGLDFDDVDEIPKHLSEGTLKPFLVDTLCK